MAKLQLPKKPIHWYTAVWMSKAAAKKKKTTTSDDKVEGLLKQLDAKKMFYGATMNLGWRLAITVLVPLIGGIKLDQRFDTLPNFTLLGVFIAAAAGSAAVWSSIKELNESQAEDEKNSKDNS